MLLGNDMEENNEEKIIKVEPTNGLIRVEDYLGRLLFMYNPATRNIEYVPIRAGKFQGSRRQKFYISTDKLRSIGSRNVISDEPTHVFVVDEVENV